MKVARNMHFLLLSKVLKYIHSICLAQDDCYTVLQYSAVLGEKKTITLILENYYENVSFGPRIKKQRLSCMLTEFEYRVCTVPKTILGNCQISPLPTCLPSKFLSSFIIQ